MYYWILFFVIKIVAHNDLGEANVAAEEFIGYSGEDVPTEPPTSLEVNEIIGPRSAVLSWKSVRPESVRGDFKGIFVLYNTQFYFAHQIWRLYWSSFEKKKWLMIKMEIWVTQSVQVIYLRLNTWTISVTTVCFSIDKKMPINVFFIGSAGDKNQISSTC